MGNILKAPSYPFVEWCQQLIQSEDWVVVDTETTGTGRDRITKQAKPAQIVEIAIINHGGKVIYATYIKPSIPIEPSAVALHGLNKQKLRNEPTFAECWPQISSSLREKKVLAFNAAFDSARLHDSAQASRITLPDLIWQCVMKSYAAHYGEPARYAGAPKWQSLIDACTQQNVSLEGIQAHSAVGDAFMAWRLIQQVALLGGNARAFCWRRVKS